ncbi:MAG: 3'-5' exonuclease [Eubacteriales bacterium]|nr:3'-5' exonuclease [Eubacteriales bacterium]
MRYVALDFETGNASPLSACALGVSVFEDTLLVREQVSLIKPPSCVGKFHWGNIRVNGIKEKMVADAPAFDSVWRDFADDAEGGVLVCHNAMFDTAVLCACLAHYHLPMPECRYICTVKVSQRVWPEMENHKLDTVSDALDIELNHHEAGSDARAAGLILQAALRETNSADADELAEKIGMRLGRISCMGTTPCSIAKDARGGKAAHSSRYIQNKGENTL